MSRVTEVSFTKQVVTGKYEHESVSITLAVSEKDDSKTALKEVKSLAYGILGSAAPKVASVTTRKTAATAEATEEKTAAPTAAEKKAAAAAKKKADAAAKKEEAAKSAATQDDVLVALRAYAEHHDSKPMAMQVIHDVTGVKALKEVDKKMYAKLVKALAV